MLPGPARWGSLHRYCAKALHKKLELKERRHTLYHREERAEAHWHHADDLDGVKRNAIQMKLKEISGIDTQFVKNYASHGDGWSEVWAAEKALDAAVKRFDRFVSKALDAYSEQPRKPA
jgi:hypothetical protein